MIPVKKTTTTSATIFVRTISSSATTVS